MLLNVLSDFIFDLTQDAQRIQNDFVIHLLAYQGNSWKITLPKKCKIILGMS